MTEDKCFFSALVQGKDWKKELLGLCSKVKTAFAGKSCDLVIFFVSESYSEFNAEIFTQILSEELSCQASLGCNTSGVIGENKEIEMEPAITVLAMHLPGVKLQPFYFSSRDVQSTETGNDLIQFMDIYPTEKPRFICLADPASGDVTQLLEAFNSAYKGVPVIGGLASGGMVRMANWLVLNGTVYQEGAVILALMGDIEFDVIVSQGCRPIGSPLIITKAEDNILYELAGRPTLEVLRELMDTLPPKDQKLIEHSLFVGLVMNEHQTQFKRGDFLIRNIMGFNPDAGSLIIGATLKVGHTLQFQLRDAETSSEDLKFLLEKSKNEKKPKNQGALLVTCCGRGKGLYGASHHDVQMIQRARGPLPLAGFFANGEIGPVGNRNYVHGYTSSLVILR